MNITKFEGRVTMPSLEICEANQGKPISAPSAPEKCIGSGKPQMDFAQKLQEIRDARYSDIQIAEELSKMAKKRIARQQVYNYRTGIRPNPRDYIVCRAILALHKQVINDKS